MPLQTFAYDTSEPVDSPDAEVELVNDALASGDARYLAHALGVIARARGMSAVARDAGVTREALYKALNEGGDPKLTTLFGVLHALNMKLSVQPGLDDKRSA